MLGIFFKIAMVIQYFKAILVVVSEHFSHTNLYIYLTLLQTQYLDSDL